jgi:hypothetical protein
LPKSVWKVIWCCPLCGNALPQSGQLPLSVHVAIHLLRDQCLLEARQQALGFGQGETDFLGSRCIAFQAGDLLDFLARFGFDDHLHRASHFIPPLAQALGE